MLINLTDITDITANSVLVSLDFFRS